MSDLSATGSLELFVYWHCDPQRAAAAMTAVAAFQADLLCACPGLQARGYVRRDEAGTRATLMETYAAPAAGMDAALQALVLSRGSEVLGPWSLGGRKLEVFERLAP